MITVNVSDSSGILFSIEVKSIGSFNRKKEIIKDILQQYMFQMRSESVLNEMKHKVQIILDTDIYNQRKQKLKRINEISQR